MGKIYIYNETYPLYGKMYHMARKEKKLCQGSKECEIKIKHDIETYMKEYGKKVGSKIEESGFLNDSKVNLSLKGDINYAKLTIIAGVVILGLYSLWKKNISVGVVAALGLLLVMFNPQLLTKPEAAPEIAPETL